MPWHRSRPWLLALIVTAAWWPVGSYWQNDDYLAVTYTRDLGNVLADFTGPQYGIESLVLFLRPIITLSFAFDGLFGTWAPFVSHLGNAVAHGISAACLGSIVSRYATTGAGWASGLVWGLAPCHASTVFWAVGRVDGYTTLWIVLSMVFLVQWQHDERRTRVPSLVCAALALGSKELAWVIPGVAAVLCFATASPGRRLLRAVQGAWPYFALFVVYLGWRFLALGEVYGGYSGARVELVPALEGLGTRTLELLNPLYKPPAQGVRGLTAHPPALVWLGFAPAALALAACLFRRRVATAGILLVLFLGCSVPSLLVWADTGNPMLLRQFYLPMMPLAALLASGRWFTAVPALAVFALPMIELRMDYQESWRRCAGWHEQVRKVLPGDSRNLNFLAGLPEQNPKGTTVEFHLFVDRLLRPPFSASDHRVLALRPMSRTAGRYELPYGILAELPIGSTFVGGPKELVKIDGPRMPAALEGTWHGPAKLDLPTLHQIVENAKIAEGRGDPAQARPDLDPYLTVPGVRSRWFRVTVFTASGYLTTHVADSGAAGAPDGRVHVGSILYGFTGADRKQRVGDLLQIATAMDLSTRFPVMIEADLRPSGSGQIADFVGTHANFRPIWLELDRLFANWWP